MWTLALSCAFFIFIHLLISGTSARDQMIKGLGLTAYRILFSIVSLAGLIWMILSYSVAVSDPLNLILWGHADSFTRIIAAVGNFIAFQLVVVGYLSPSPTRLSLLKPRLPDTPVYGIIRVSRHPVLAGIGIWSLLHLIVSGNMASWLFFGTLLMICLLGAASIDRKKTAEFGEAYAAIKRRTSTLPMIAVFQGRTVFIAGEIGAARPFLAFALFCLSLVLHEMLFAARAL